MNPFKNKFAIIGLLAIILQFPNNARAESTVRVHAGGGAFTDDLGNAWAADNYFNTGSTYTSTAAIDGTGNDAIYQSERYDAAGGSELTYTIPVTPGVYKVRLHFAEIYFTAPGQRVFDVSIQNQVAFSNLDIVAEAGAKNKALVKEYAVTVTGSTLTITLIHKTENPKISALEVVPGAAVAPTAKIQAAPAALAFGSVSLSQSASLNLTLSNTGTAALSISTLTLSGAQAGQFSFTAALPLSIAPGASATLPVKFTPTAAAAATATLALASNDPATPNLTVPLSGTGSQIAPAVLTAAPGSMAFGSVALNTPSTPANLVLSNTGGSPLTISALTLSGAQAAEFSLTPPALPLTLAPAATASIPVRFTPAAVGVRAATLAVTSSAGNANVPLSGTGAAAAALSTVRIHAGGGAYTDDVGNVWAADNYYNTGVTFTSTSPIDGTGNDPLYQSERYDEAGGSELTYTIPVTPGAYNVRLHFAEIYATAPGQRVFDVSIENQTAFAGLDIFAQAGAKNKALVKEYAVTVTGSTLTVTLIHKIENPKISAIEVVPGTAVVPAAKIQAAPAALAFGSVSPTQSASLNLTLSNTGTAALSVSALTLSGAQTAQFSFTAALPISIAAGASATLPVKFTPTAAAAAAATLTLASNDPATPNLAVPLSGTGAAAATLSTVRIHAGGGAYTDDLGNAWAADNYYNTGVTFTSTAPIDGTGNDALYQSERYDEAGGSELTYTIPVTPGAYMVRLHFAEIYVNAAGLRTFDVSIQNQVAFSNLDIFAQAGAKNKALVKEYAVTVIGSTLTVTLIHKIENPKISALEVIPASGGSAGPPVLSVSPAAINFGNVDAGTTSSPVSLVLSNTGGSPLVVSALTLSGTDAGEFAITAPALPLTLASGATAAIPVRFSAGEAGVHTASLAIASNQSAGNVNVAISGNGVAVTVPVATSTYRIHAGGGAFTDDAGNAWDADKYYNTGSVSSVTTPISGTNNAALYQTERYDLAGGAELTYAFPVTPGYYKVRLHFAETYVTAPGQRVFDVSIEDQIAFSNLDVFAQSGGMNTALIKEYDVTVSDDTLSVSLLHKVENPQICGLEILPTAGGHVHPFLHVVIESDFLAVDYDGDGKETMHFNGAPSHTHQLGKILLHRQWDLDGSPLADASAVDIDIPEGDHAVGLTIADNNIPPESLHGAKAVKVAPADLVPGALALYFPSATPAALLNATLGKAARAAILPTMTLALSNAPVPAPYLAVFQTRILLAAAGQYTFTATGGSSTKLFLNGAAVTGPVTIAPGLVYLEARFAVGTTDPAPLQVSYSLGISPAAPFPPSLVYHDETDLLPIVNTFTAQGSAEGFPVDITGLGFFPKGQVQVVVGTKVFQGASLTGTPTALHFTAPAGTGDVQGYVSAPNGTSLPFTLKYTSGASTNISFATSKLANMPSPTQAVWGPDGRLYVTSLEGWIMAYTLDDNYQITATQTISTLVGVKNLEIMGIAFNPLEAAGPVKMYIAHSLLHSNGGACFTGPSEYNSQISVLTGPNFSTLQPIITGLPTSNHDHGVSGIEFDNHGDLLITSAGTTNAGVINCGLGNVPESPLSAAILKAQLSKPGFNGTITYRLSSSGLPSTDQVQGELVDVAPGVDVSVVAFGLRNSYDLALTTSNRIFATDNGPNAGYGEASLSATTQGPHPQTDDELNLIVPGSYYGHPNRSRGRYDNRQNLYHGVTEASIPGVFTQAKLTVPASTNGIVEYRAQNFGGAMRGNLLLQKWNGDTYRVVLGSDSETVTSAQPLAAFLGGLDVTTIPGGALLSADYTDSILTIAKPNNAGTGTEAFDIFPWRGPITGGVKFEIGGMRFGNLGNTTVTIGGAAATITSVSATRIRGILPTKSAASTGMEDVMVTSNGSSMIIPKAFRFLAP
ncbi:MAG: malectin domain-containing carbohydrate-binding protein [Fibrobacteria bacterium]